MCALGLGTWALAADAPSSTPRELRLPDPADRYIDEQLPGHFQTPGAKLFDNTPADNPLSDAGVLLGRMLFYDTRLSASGTVSCGSCHLQQHAFADPRRLSRGHAGQLTDRNSMSLVNLRFSKAGKFWDERVATLEEQVLIPIQSESEMGQTLPKLIEILQQDERYPPRFAQAFGDQEITSERVAKSLAQFLRSLVSHRSRYDQGLAAVAGDAEDFPNFTSTENLGKALFLEKCAICHRDGRGRQSAFFTSFRSLNNGVDATADVSDGGAGDVTLVPSDFGLFRPSDLRNVEFTAPYMHDGRFSTLEDVVEHYSTGVARHPNVSGFAFRMQFTEAQQAALVAFLKTFSDKAFLTDSRFSDPWTRTSPEGDTASVDTAGDTPQRETQVSPAAALTDQERARRLEQRIGLPRGESLRYLHDLDLNRDHVLDRDETRPLAELLLKTGAPARFDRRRFTSRELRPTRGAEVPPAMMVFDTDKNKRLSAGEFPEERRYVLEVADLDADGELSVDEARRFEIVERFLAAQAGDRDRTRMTRLLESLQLVPAEAERVQQTLQQAQRDLRREKERLDADVSQRLAAALGPQNYARFQEMMLVSQDAQELSRRGGGITADSLQDQIFEFDDDRNQLLNDQELGKLAAILDETQGGFGTARLPLPSVRQYSDRVLARDVDHDGAVTRSEIPERLRFLIERGDADHNGALSRKELDDFLRTTSYERFLQEGIYQSGGFLNAYTGSMRLLDDLSLTEAERQPLRALIESHERQIQSTIAQVVATAYRQLRNATSSTNAGSFRAGSPPAVPARRSARDE
jgi:cytochrome c peroxidase